MKGITIVMRDQTWIYLSFEGAIYTPPADSHFCPKFNKTDNVGRYQEITNTYTKNYIRSHRTT